MNNSTQTFWKEFNWTPSYDDGTGDLGTKKQEEHDKKCKYLVGNINDGLYPALSVPKGAKYLRSASKEHQNRRMLRPSNKGFSEWEFKFHAFSLGKMSKFRLQVLVSIRSQRINLP